MENVKDGIKPGRPSKNTNNVRNLSQKELENRNNVPVKTQTGGEIGCWSI